MRLLTLLLAVLVICAAPARSRGQAPASVLFSEDFESGALRKLKWWARGSGHITTDPQNPANHVVRFATQTSNGDVFSVFVPYHAQLKLSFDFLKTTENAYGFIGTDHAFCCDHHQWLWNSEQWPGGGVAGNVAVNQWTHVSTTFSPHDNGGTRDFVLKLQQTGVSPGSPTSSPASAFFDNVVLETVQ